MQKTAKKQRFLVLFLCAALLAALLPQVTAAADSTYSLKFNDRKASTKDYYYSMRYETDFQQGETITVTKNGKATTFTWLFNNFYDKNWKSLNEHGLAVEGVWDPDSMERLSKLFDNIGYTFVYRYYLFAADKEGNPIDSEGNVTEDPEKIQILAVSSPFKVTANPEFVSKVIDGIVYSAYIGTKTAFVSYTEKEIKGTVKIPRTVKIEGKTYPVTRFGNSPGLIGQEKMTGIVLPNTITEFDEGALTGTGLKEVSIPDSVTEIGKGAFGYNSVRDPKTGMPQSIPVKGFTIYAKDRSPAADYALDNGFTLITEKTAAKMKTTIKAAAVKKNRAALTWKKVKHASGYQICWKYQNTGKYKKAATIKNGSAEKWVSGKLSNLKIGKTMLFKIRPFTNVGGTIVYGKWSKAKAAKVRK